MDTWAKAAVAGMPPLPEAVNMGMNGGVDMLVAPPRAPAQGDKEEETKKRGGGVHSSTLLSYTYNWLCPCVCTYVCT